MDNRGSKSAILAVKEQRVDGSWLLKNWVEWIRSLRCILMGFERNYQVKVLTNQLLYKFYSTLNNQKLNPWFITGFTDAEGSFIISIYRDAKSKLKWRVSAYFSIHIHEKDLPLLELIQKTLGVGIVRKNNENTVLFRVSNIKELQIIINHFKKYPLVSSKYLDFLLFEQCLELIKEKAHLTEEGLLETVSLKANLNKGLSKELLEAFPNIETLERLEYKFKGIPDPTWVSGFVTGDSTFSVSIEKGTTKLGKRVRLIFGTCLHIREKDLLIGISEYFSSLYLNSNEINKESSIHCNESKNTALLQIKSTSDINKKVIPFFTEYPILGMKSLDFEDFKKVAELVKNKEHLKNDGLNKIMKIVDKMNLDREWK
jgi:LAGLIDADG DNA endonuclease family protein